VIYKRRIRREDPGMFTMMKGKERKKRTKEK
jgi:hypothetical protein